MEVVYNCLAIHDDDLDLVKLVDPLGEAVIEEPDEEGYHFVSFCSPALSLFDKQGVYELEQSCTHPLMLVTDIDGEIRGPFGEHLCHRDQPDDEPWPDFLENGISAGEMVRRAVSMRVAPRGTRPARHRLG